MVNFPFPSINSKLEFKIGLAAMAGMKRIKNKNTIALLFIVIPPAEASF